MKKILSMAVLFLFLFTACNKCSDTDCQNGGTCDNGECACPFEYEGDNCEAKTIAKHTGGYSIVITTPFGSDTDTLFIFSDPADAKKFYIGESATESAFANLTSRTEFVIPEQVFDEDEGTTASGTGTFTSTGFNATLNANISGFPATLQLVGTKL